MARDSTLALLQTTGKTKSLTPCGGEVEERITAASHLPVKDGLQAFREQDASCGFFCKDLPPLVLS